MSPEEFNRVFRAQLPMISAYLSRRVPISEVEDLASDLFEIAWSKKEQIPEGFELPWLYKTARYLSLTFIASNLGAMASWPGSPNQ